MSEASTQKLLVAITCVFGVALVLIGYGRQRNRGFERYTLNSNPAVAGHSNTPAPNREQPLANRQVVPRASHLSLQWQSRPVNVQSPAAPTFARPEEYPARDPLYNQQGSIGNHFNSSANFESQPSEVPARHPSAQKIAQRNYHLRQRTNQTVPQPVSQPTSQTPPAIQFHDFGNIGQAAATLPISQQDSDIAQSVVESRTPERDLFTVQPAQQNSKPTPPVAKAASLPKKRVSNAYQTNEFFKAGSTEQLEAVSPVPQQLPQSNQSDVVVKIPISEAPSVRVDGGVRKVNWTEIEAAPRVDLMSNFRPLEQPTLMQRRANQQVESAAREQIQYGQSLARRRAYFAAREEFIKALLLIATSYNSESNSTVHPERLAQGLIAIDELGDFETSSGSLLQQKVLSHKSQLITPQELATASPTQVIGLYSNFAQSQIQQAIGSSAAGSEALHALGKLESMVPQAGRNQIKKLTLYRAAINIDPSNAVCANDLGVLLFNMGRLEEAEKALIAAARLKQTELGWNNLALVHRQRAANAGHGGERDRQLSLANLAAQQAAKLAGQSSDNQSNNQRANNNQWASPNEFQDNAAFPNVVVQHADSRSPKNTSRPSPSKSATLKQKMKDWF